MDNVKLHLVPRDAKGNPLHGNAPSPGLTLSMKFLHDLPSDKSLFRFHFDLNDGKAPLIFYIVSDEAADIFRYYEDVFYSDPAPASIQTGVADANGTAHGTVKVALSSKADSSGSAHFTVTSYSFALSDRSIDFYLTDSDTAAFYLFFNTLLGTHAPNGPN